MIGLAAGAFEISPFKPCLKSYVFLLVLRWLAVLIESSQHNDHVV